MNLKHTALLTLLFLLMQQTGFVFAAVSITPLNSSVQFHQYQSNSHQHQHKQTHPVSQTDSVSMHHDDGQHCKNWQCCSVLGCYVAVNVFELPLFSSAPGAVFAAFQSNYTSTNPAGLYRPPGFL